VALDFALRTAKLLGPNPTSLSLGAITDYRTLIPEE
jgi:hypothetical protein